MVVNYFAKDNGRRIEYHYSWRQDDFFRQVISNENPEDFADNEFLNNKTYGFWTNKVWVEMNRINESGRVMDSVVHYNKG